MCHLGPAGTSPKIADTCQRSLPSLTCKKWFADRERPIVTRSVRAQGGCGKSPVLCLVAVILSGLRLLAHCLGILARPIPLHRRPPHQWRRQDLRMGAICGLRLRNPEVPAIRPCRSMGLAVPTRAETAAPSLARIRSSPLLHWLACGSVRRFPSPSRADKARVPVSTC